MTNWPPLAVTAIGMWENLSYLLSSHADRHAGDISFTVCFSVCPQETLVKDISGVGWYRAIKFCRMVDLGVRQVFSPFGELSPRD